MDKVKIGIPRSIPYYYCKELWISFFEKLNIEIIESPKTNKEIIAKGIRLAQDEMCLALKVFIGHVDYLVDKCDFILIPRIEDYGVSNQTCTNLLSLYDVINNILEVNILNYNIATSKKQTEIKGFYKIGQKLGKSKTEIKKTYLYAKTKQEKTYKRKHHLNLQKLLSSKTKILIIGYPYNIYDEYIGIPILKYLESLNIEWLVGADFDPRITNKLAPKLSKDLYWKFSKELIGSIELVGQKIAGIIFLSVFPCGPDSLVNELVIRKIKSPYLYLVIDDLDSIAGIEMRIESFIDIIEQEKSII